MSGVGVGVGVQRSWSETSEYLNRLLQSVQVCFKHYLYRQVIASGIIIILVPVCTPIGALTTCDGQTEIRSHNKYHRAKDRRCPLRIF